MKESKKTWSSNSVMQRMLTLMGKLPADTGLDSRSVTVSALSVRARCLAVYRALADRVSRAVQCPAPHPEFGDDGHRDSIREWALQDLYATERWVDFHHKNGWDFELVRQYPDPDRLPPGTID